MLTLKNQKSQNSKKQTNVSNIESFGTTIQKKTVFDSELVSGLIKKKKNSEQQERNVQLEIQFNEVSSQIKQYPQKPLEIQFNEISSQIKQYTQKPLEIQFNEVSSQIKQYPQKSLETQFNEVSSQIKQKMKIKFQNFDQIELQKNKKRKEQIKLLIDALKVTQQQMQHFQYYLTENESLQALNSIFPRQVFRKNEPFSYIYKRKRISKQKIQQGKPAQLAVLFVKSTMEYNKVLKQYQDNIQQKYQLFKSRIQQNEDE